MILRTAARGTAFRGLAAGCSLAERDSGVNAAAPALRLMEPAWTLPCHHYCAFLSGCSCRAQPARWAPEAGYLAFFTARKAVSQEAAHPTQLTQRTQALIRIGITLHVLADTFARANFVGVPSEFINEVSEVCDADDSSKITLLPFKDYSPTVLSSGYGYTGHGRIGHLPDEPWRSYTYKNSWTAQPIARRNPEIYAEAFQYLSEALKQILKPAQPAPLLSSRDFQFPEAVRTSLAQIFAADKSVEAQGVRWKETNIAAGHILHHPKFQGRRGFYGHVRAAGVGAPGCGAG